MSRGGWERGRAAVVEEGGDLKYSMVEERVI